MCHTPHEEAWLSQDSIGSGKVRGTPLDSRPRCRWCWADRFEMCNEIIGRGDW
jgi:hypothetical protein